MDIWLKLRRIAAAILFFAALTLNLGSINVAFAQDATPTAEATARQSGPEFVIYPTGGSDGDFFEIEMEPGATRELSVTLGNADSQSLELISYASDVVPSTNGGFAVAREDDSSTGPANWVEYPLERYDFEPGEGVERRFLVTVPEDASPGQYMVGIVLQTADELPVADTEMFTQTIRKVIQVAITVPGPIEPSFSLHPAEYSVDTGVGMFSIEVENQGNVLVRPEGEFSLKDKSGQVVFVSPVAMGSVYAGLTSPLVLVPNAPIPDGDYKLSLSLADSATGASATIDDQLVVVTSEQDAPDQFQLEAEVVAEPESRTPIYLEVNATATNTGEPVASTEIVLDVMLDGDVVESFSLASSLALPTGDTEVIQRYIPPSGFSPGEWTFAIRLNVVDPSTGAATTVVTLEDIPPIVVP